MVVIPVFYTYATGKLRNRNIIYFQGILNDDRELKLKIQRRLTFSSIISFIFDLSIALNSYIPRYLVINPYENLIVENIADHIVVEVVKTREEWMNPYIEAEWVLFQDKNIVTVMENEYQKFQKREQAVGIERYISLPIFAVFKPYWEKLAIYYFNIPQIPLKQLQDIVEETDRVFISQILGMQLPTSSVSLQKSKEFLNYFPIQFDERERQFMYYLNYIIDKHASDLEFEYYSPARLYDRIVFINYLFNPTTANSYNLVLLAKSIEYELENPYPSFDGIHYFQSFINILEKNEIYRHPMEYYKIVNLRFIEEYYTNLEQINLAHTTSINVFDKIVAILLDFNNNTKEPQNIKFLQNNKEIYVRIVQKLVKSVAMRGNHIKSKLYIIRTHYELQKDHQLEMSYTNLDNLYNSMVREKIQITEPVASWQKELHIIQVFHLILIYYQYFRFTRYNPQLIVENINLSDYINKTLSEISISEDPSMINEQVILGEFRNFNKIDKIVSIIFGDLNPEDKLHEIITRFRTKNYYDVYFGPIYRRILLFITDNLEDLTTNSIDEFLSLLQEIKNDNFLTLEALMKNLLLKLIRKNQLSEQDYVYLQYYLNLDSKHIDDFGKEGLLDLIFQLSMLENSSTINLEYKDTMMRLKTTRSSEAKPKDNSKDGEMLPIIPPSVFDIFDSFEDLRKYIKLFYMYYSKYWDFKAYKEDDRDLSIENIYIDLIQSNNIIELLNTYFHQLTELKKNDQSIIDDISLGFLNIQLIIESDPSLAIPDLSEIENKLRSRDAGIDDWKELFETYGRIYSDIGEEDKIAWYQIQLLLLDIYRNPKKDTQRDIFYHQLVDQIPVVEYLDLFQHLDIELFSLLEKMENYKLYIIAVMAYHQNSLNILATHDLDPFIESQVLVHLSYDNPIELQYLLRQTQDYDMESQNILNRGSQIWFGGFLAGINAIHIRILQLLGIDDKNSEHLNQVLENLLDDKFSRFDDRIEIYFLILEYTYSDGDYEKCSLICQYMCDQLIGYALSPELIGSYLIKLVPYFTEFGRKDYTELIFDFYKLHHLDQYISAFDENTNDSNQTINGHISKIGAFPKFDAILMEYQNERNNSDPDLL